MSQANIDKIKKALKSKTLPANTRKSLLKSLKKLEKEVNGVMIDYFEPQEPKKEKKSKDENIFQTGSEASKEYKDKNKQLTVFDVMTKTGLKNKELVKEYRKVINEVNKNSDYTFAQKKSVVSSVMTMDKKDYSKGVSKVKAKTIEPKDKGIKEPAKANDYHVIVKTWNGEGYSEDNFIESFEKNKSNSYFANYFMEQSLLIPDEYNVDDYDVDLEVTDKALNFTIEDEDSGSIQALKLKINHHAVLILTSINEVKLLTATDYLKFIKLLTKHGVDIEENENGDGRHFFDIDELSKLPNNPYEESDIQLEVLNPKEPFEFTKPKQTVKKKQPKAKTEKTDGEISDFLKECKEALNSANFKVSKIKTKNGTKTVKKSRSDNSILNSKMKSVAKTILKDIKPKDEPERYNQAQEIIDIITEITKKLDKLVLTKSISELATIKKFFEKF